MIQISRNGQSEELNKRFAIFGGWWEINNYEVSVGIIFSVQVAAGCDGEIFDDNR